MSLPTETTPTGAEQLAGALVRLGTDHGLQLYFVTGITTVKAGSPDVIRGEETEIVGAISMGIGDGTFVMPGTHSKWVIVRDSRIVDFTTYMSGEVYGALCQHTILGTLMKEGSFCKAQFREGVRKGIDARPRLLHTLFSVRTLPLFGKLVEESVADYLSGMLISAEPTYCHTTGFGA